MSKLRQNVPEATGDLEVPAAPDLRPFVVFTQLKEGGPFQYAGWLDAADDAMAVQFGREHYGQDQQCVHLCVIPRDAIYGDELGPEPTDAATPHGPYRCFTQTIAGDIYVSAESIDAPSTAAAMAQARAAHEDMHDIWIVPETAIVTTGDDDLIWRYTDQTYRLARGYSKDVRSKWERIRAERDLSEYEKGDLKETF